MKNKVDLKLDWCGHKAAEFACKNWHYSSSMPRTKIIKIGVWENNIYIGCILFSWGSCQNLMKPYGLNMEEGCELTRIAMREHITPISRMISIAIKMIKDLCPGLRVIVSFADPYHGHLGGIYQASNWIYAGKTPPSNVYEDENGKIWHSRNVSETGWVKYGNKWGKARKPSGLEKIRLPGKYRYLYPLDKEMGEKIVSRSKPYPKKICDGSDLADTPGVHSGEGGSIPTPSLKEIRATVEHGNN